jgi:predicted negative regulator of RcsB-dependent stress response
VLLQEQGDVTGAQVAYRQAIDSGHPDQAPRAAINLGNLLAEQGDVAGARAAFQQAIDSGHSDQASAALRALQQLGQQ